MKKIILIILFAALVAVNVSAGDAGQESPFTIGAGAKALGMGGGFVSLADDASAIYYNPAKLPYLNFQEASFMHIDLFEGTIYNYAGWVFPDTKLGGFGIGYFRIGTDDIERTSNFVSNGTFGYSQSQILFSYGQTLGDKFSVGGSFKIVNQSLDQLSDYGLGVDFAFSLDITKNISTGVIFRDIVPPELELENLRETTPISIAGGIGLKQIKLNESAVLSTALEVEKIENRTAKIHTGSEVLLNESFALRIGYDKENISFGSGLSYNRLKIDYAYKIMENINDSHRFSLSFLIGKSIEDKLLEEEQMVESRGSKLLEEEQQKQFEFYRSKANEYHHNFKLDSALTYYQRALAFDEHNVEIIGIIAGIENSIEIQRETELTYKQMHQETESARVRFLTQAQNFFDKKYYNAALDMLQLIFDFSPGYAEAKYLKAQIDKQIKDELTAAFAQGEEAEKNGDNIEAVIAYHRIVDIEPENSKALEAIARISKNINIVQQLNSGIQLYKNNNYRAARNTFNAVLLLDKQSPIAIEYLKKLNTTSSQETTLEDLQANKKIWNLYLDGLKFMRNKEYQKAIDAWQKVLEEYPNNINTINNIEQANLRLLSEQTK